MQTIKVILETVGSTQNGFNVWNLVIPALSAIFGVLAAGFFNYLNNNRTLKSKKTELEISEIKEALTEFYYPILLLIRKNKQMYDIFKYQKPDDFRTLPALLDGQAFDDNDGEILKSIINLDKSINQLIVQYKGKVKNKEIANLLAKASTHFDVIIMAYDHSISGESERFSGFVYPRELQGKIEKEVDSLEEKLHGLEKR